MNRHFRFLLMSMIIPLTLFVKDPLDNAPTGNYIELQEMPSATIHDPLAHDPHPQVPYQSLEDLLPTNPDHDLSQTVPSKSPIQRRIIGFPLPEEGLIDILKACFSCCFPPQPQQIVSPNPSDDTL